MLFYDIESGEIQTEYCRRIICHMRTKWNAFIECVVMQYNTALQEAEPAACYAMDLTQYKTHPAVLSCLGVIHFFPIYYYIYIYVRNEACSNENKHFLLDVTPISR